MTCAKAIDCIVDRDSVMELKGRFGRSICTMVARLDGHPVGILASNPMFKGGAIDVDACNKAISFLVLCDSFNIPLVFLVDQPGFRSASRAIRAAPGRIMNWMNAIAVTVPKIFGDHAQRAVQAYLNMGGGRTPTSAGLAQRGPGLHGARVGANVLFGVNEQDDPSAIANWSRSCPRHLAWGWRVARKRMR